MKINNFFTNFWKKKSYLQEDDEVLKNEVSEAWKQRKEELEKVVIFKFTLNCILKGKTDKFHQWPVVGILLVTTFLFNSAEQ